MKDYRSICYISSNENGRQELRLERHLTFWEQMAHCVNNFVMCPPLSWVDVYEVNGTVWVEKRSGKVVDKETQFECFEAKGWAKRQSDSFI